METSRNPHPQQAPRTGRWRRLPTATTIIILLLFFSNVLEYFRKGEDRNIGLIVFNVVASLRLLSRRLAGY